MDKSILGQTSQSNFDIYLARTKDNENVTKNPKRKPSHVFFGDNFINGVFPNKIPIDNQILILNMV